MVPTSGFGTDRDDVIWFLVKPIRWRMVKSLSAMTIHTKAIYRSCQIESKRGNRRKGLRRLPFEANN